MATMTVTNQMVSCIHQQVAGYLWTPLVLLALLQFTESKGLLRHEFSPSDMSLMCIDEECVAQHNKQTFHDGVRVSRVARSMTLLFSGHAFCLVQYLVPAAL